MQKKNGERKKNGHGEHGEKKGKTGGTTIELPTKRGKKSMKTTGRKIKAER